MSDSTEEIARRLVERLTSCSGMPITKEESDENEAMFISKKWDMPIEQARWIVSIGAGMGFVFGNRRLKGSQNLLDENQ